MFFYVILCVYLCNYVSKNKVAITYVYGTTFYVYGITFQNQHFQNRSKTAFPMAINQAIVLLSPEVKQSIQDNADPEVYKSR